MPYFTSYSANWYCQFTSVFTKLTLYLVSIRFLFNISSSFILLSFSKIFIWLIAELFNFILLSFTSISDWTSLVITNIFYHKFVHIKTRIIKVRVSIKYGAWVNHIWKFVLRLIPTTIITSFRKNVTKGKKICLFACFNATLIK